MSTTVEVLFDSVAIASIEFNTLQEAEAYVNKINTSSDQSNLSADLCADLCDD